MPLPESMAKNKMTFCVMSGAEDHTYLPKSVHLYLIFFAPHFLTCLDSQYRHTSMFVKCTTIMPFDVEKGIASLTSVIFCVVIETLPKNASSDGGDG